MGSKLSPAYRSSRLASRRQTTTCWGVRTTSGGRRWKLWRLDLDLDPGSLLAVWTGPALARLRSAGEGEFLIAEAHLGGCQAVNTLAVGVWLAGFPPHGFVNQVQLSAHP